MAETTTNSYEITFILQQEDPSEVRQILGKNQAEIVGGKDLEKIRLAYPIQKQKFGFLGTFRFGADPDSIRGMLSDLKLEKSVIRYMISKAGTETVAPSGERERKTSLQPRESRDEKVPVMDRARKPAAPVLTNEELEKKIEEILQ